MKKKNALLLIVLALILVTAVVAVLHLTNRDTVPEGAIALIRDGKTSYVEMEKLSLTDVTGQTVNGKGETKDIDAKGVLLSDVTGTDLTVVTVTADDEYAAEVPAEDLDRAYLILTEDGTARLIVFGDSNSKRDVKNVVKIEVAG